MLKADKTEPRAKRLRRDAGSEGIYPRLARHCYVAKVKRTLQNWNGWLRRKFRMYIWKQRKKSRTKMANMQKLGIPAEKAYQ